MNGWKMRARPVWIAFTTLLGIALAVGAAGHAFAALATPAPKPVTLSGYLVPALKGHKALGAINSQQALTLVIALQPRNAAQMQTMVQQAQERGKRQTHAKPLTPMQVTDAFGRTPSEIGVLRSYLQSQGLYVTKVAGNNLAIDVTGSASAVEKAFSIQIQNFSLQGRTVFAPVNNPTVPASVSEIIKAIIGLDNVAIYRPHYVFGGAARSGALQPHNTGTGPGGDYAPSDLRTAYDMNSLISSSDGTGQTIPVFELAGYTESDVQQYRNDFTLGTLNYSNVLIDGASVTPAPNDRGPVEVELDMEVISAIAPGATQSIYIGPNSSAGVYDTFNQIGIDNYHTVVSASWGVCEPYQALADMQALNGVFNIYALEGLQLFAAAGDNGAYDCSGLGGTSLAVDYPASDPNVLGVGGTSLVTNGATNETRLSETVWGDTTNNSGGGGGNSVIFPMSAVQQGPNVVNSESTGFRPVPDVAADADPATGYAIYCSVASAGCTTAGYYSVGGTSAAASLWAAAMADINEYSNAQVGYSVWPVDGTLYQMLQLAKQGQLSYAPYYDVTSGNNLYYAAQSGFDLATGMGAPDAWNLARDIIGQESASNWAQQLSTTWYFAEGYTGGSFTEYLTLANPNLATAHVNVTYLLQNGSSPVNKTYTVAGESRKTVNVNTELGVGVGVSMEVYSDIPIIAERPMYFTFTGAGLNVPGGTDVLGATGLGSQFDFGYLDTTANHATYLTVLNGDTVAMTVSVNYYAASSGALTTVTHTVPASARGTILVNNDVPAGTYSATVTLSTFGLVERPMYLTDSTTGYTGSADVIGVQTLSNSWYFAEGYTNTNFSERYILSNPGGSTAHATVTFLLSNGTQVPITVTINPGEQQVVDANAALGNAVNNSATVTSDVAILAERFMSFQYNGPVGTSATSSSIPGATDVLGATSPGYWYGFAEGYNGGNFAEYLTIENPNGSAATVALTYLPANGSAPTIQMVTVNAYSRYTINTNNVISGQSFSVTVNASASIVVERPMYYLYGSSQTGGSDVVGYTIN